jgi:tetratricopeptide (TPR) repeat protein
MKPLAKAAYHFQRGEYGDVERICGEILKTNPNDERAWQMRGLAALQLQRFDLAATFLTEAIARKEAPQTLINLSVALLALGKLGEAAEALERAIALDGTNPKAYVNLAACYMRGQRYADADAAIEKALSLQPDWPMALDMRAAIALKQADYERAGTLAAAALAKDQRLGVSHRVLADLAMGRMEYDVAAEHYRQSLLINPDDAESQGNFGLLLARCGEYREATSRYRNAVIAAPDDAALHHGFGDVLLIQGLFSEGWGEHAWRHLMKEDNLPLVDRPFLSKLPEGGSAVALLDQGIGDQIMMASMIPDLLRRFPSLEIQCDRRLHALFKRSFPDVRFSSFVMRSTPGATPVPGSFGVAETGPWLRSRFEDFPKRPGYLKADAALRDVLRKRYTKKPGGPVVGLSWATRKVKLGPHKSMPLAAWGPLLSVPGVTFVNLQYDSDPAEIDAAARQFGARIISDPEIDPTGDLDAFAAQIAAMDLVVTTSNAAAHVAGALNVPTWVFVPMGMGGLWHWFLDRDDSPWYPSVRLFRQSKRGEWQDVLARASAAFVAFVEQWPARNP